jgi:hypothetical protein
MKLYIFRTIPLSIIRISFTVHSAMVHVIQVCRQLLSRTRMEFHPGPALICEISASSWFYYKEICYNAQSHKCKISYYYLPINQKYFMTFSTKNYYYHRAYILIKKPLSFKKLQNPTRNGVFVGPIIFLY